MIVGVEWREIPGFPGYFACSDGSVWSVLPKGRKGAAAGAPLRLKPNPDANGYLMYYMRRPDGRVATRKGHHLVLEAFGFARPEGLVTRHLNGNRTDNRLENLRWGTMAENAADRERHGNQHHGERNSEAILTEDAVREIRAARLHRGMRPSGMQMLADKFGVSKRAIQHVRARTSWAHVEG